MKYTHFFVDLDDTLLDFKASEELSFFKVFQKRYSQELILNLYDSYKKINERLWRQVEENALSKDVLKFERFRQLSEQFKLEDNPSELAHSYLKFLPENIVLLDGALFLCEFLRKHGEIIILTNGIKETQEKRILNCDLKNYISALCVSEESGFAKPDTRFFDFAAEKIKDFNKKTTLMIGDRLETDILGAQNFGIDSIWLNTQKILNSSEIKPTWTCTSTLQIVEILSEH